MTTTTANVTPSAASLPWVRHARMVLAVGVAWGLLELLVTQAALPRGLTRPAVLVDGHPAALAIPLTLVALWVGSAAGLLISGRRHVRDALLIAAWAMILWIFPYGTMDDWLIAMRPKPGPPEGAAYWPLLVDYVFLAAGFIGVAAIGVAAERWSGAVRTVRLKGLAGEARYGVPALAVTAVVAALLLWPCLGPAVGHTYRGQVYFALIASFWLGRAAARQVLKPAQVQPVWLWVTPLLLGLIGVVMAGLRPALMLGEDYQNIDVLPAWWLARPLPVEMLSVGLLGLLWSREPEPDQRATGAS